MKLTNLTPILNVSSVPASMKWFEALGWQRGFSWNDGGLICGAADGNAHGPANFGGVRCGHYEVFLCCGGQGARNGRLPRRPGDDDTGGVWMSWWFKTPAEVDEVYALAQRLGVTATYPPTNEPWGIRECHIQHPDGHTFRISAPIDGCDEDE